MLLASQRSTGLCALFACLLALGGCAEGEAREVGAVIAALRPDSLNSAEPPPLFGANDKVERFDSPGGSFRVHYTQNGEHAVPAGDADEDGVPDSVEEVAAEYDAVGDFYASELGFERPLSDADVPDGNGGDGRFDVYLLDFPTSADGAFRREQCLSDAAFRCTGYMLHENDFAGRNYPSRTRANRILASHEYFHAIQTAYNSLGGVVVGEGTAVWASEQYDPSLPDLEGFVDGYLEHTDRSLTQEPTGPVDPFAYGSSLFFQFLSERYDRDVVRELWEALRAQGRAAEPESWAGALDEVLQRDHESALPDAFAEFAQWNLHTGPRADPAVAYQRGEGYGEPALDEVTLPFEDETVRVFPLAVRYYTARVRESGPVRFALRSDASLDGLRVILARGSRDTIEQIEVAKLGVTTSVTLADAESGDTLYAAVLNTRASGESLRPDLCLGTSEQCGSSAREPDAGSSDEPERETDDSGCNASARGGSGLASSFALVLLVASVTRWRARRRR